MADYFTLFAVSINDLNEAEYQWWLSQLRTIIVYDADDAINKIWEGPSCFYNTEMADHADWLGFEYEFGPPDDAGRRSLLIFSDDAGDLELTAFVLQQFLRVHCPDKCVILEAAFTCSKAEPGAFGGTTAYIKAGEIVWFDTHTAARAYERNHGSSPGTHPQAYLLNLDVSLLREQRARLEKCQSVDDTCITGLVKLLDELLDQSVDCADAWCVRADAANLQPRCTAANVVNED